jgi:hypothetical protein
MSKHRHKEKTATPLSLLELLEEQIDEDALLRGVELSEDDIIGAAMKQPELYWSCGRLYVQSVHKRASLEMRLEGLRSEIGLKLRAKRDDKGKRKIDTEGHVKAYIETTPEIRKLRKRINLAIKMETASKQLLEVYKMRKEIIQVIMFAGKISLHMHELELLKGNRKLARAVMKIRQNWKNPADED